MDDVELNKFVDQWIVHWKWRLVQPEPQTDDLDWLNPKQRPPMIIPPEYVDCDWDRVHENMDFLWRFIQLACERKLSDRLIGILAAFQLEDLLTWAGPEYIDRVEDLAKWDDKFNYLLGGVRRSCIEESVWERLQKARRQEW